MSQGKIFAFVSTVGFVLLTSATAFAQAADAAANNFSTFSMLGLAAGIAIGIAASGAALGQGKAAAAALEGIARNPGAADKLQTPLLLSLAFMEALGILAFVIAFLLQSKIVFA
jgi:F-type H+-transporting ATPase subunit c